MSLKVAGFVRMTIMLSTASLAAPATLAADDDVLLDQVVVTAQKREESLRDVPLSVEAVTGEKLADIGVLRLDDMKSYVPNLQMTETGIANNIYIRGIGSGLNTGFEQSVSTYMDGIYRGRGHQSRMPFLDLSRVEVLRGPQPILFGKNAVAGAVNLVAAQPGKEFEGLARVSRDVELDETVANLVLSGPLSDSTGARLAVYHRHSDGYIHNGTLGTDEPRRNELAGRFILRGTPSDALDISLRLEGGAFDSDGRQIEIFGETPITVGALAPLNLTYSKIVGGTIPPFITQGRSASALNNTVDGVRSSNGDRSNTGSFESALTVNYRFANDLTLTSISGFSHYGLNEVCDCDFVGATIFTAGIKEQYDQYSQELRFTSPTGGDFSWIGGLFWQRYELDENDYLYVPPTSLVMSVLAQNPALGATPQARAAAASLFSNAANPRVYLQNSKLYSAFAQGTWKLNDRFNITAGGRLTKEDKEGARRTRLALGMNGPDLATAAPAPLRPFVLPLFSSVLGIVPHSVAGERSETNFSPLVNFQYHLTEETMYYLSLSRGYKSGGFDARSNKPPSAGGTFEFEDEKATTYELGLKSGLGSTAEVNADIFYTDYKDLQTSAFDGAIGFNIGNGTAKVKGVELQTRWKPTRQLLLTGSVAYLDFEWKNYQGQCYFDRLLAAPTVSNCDYSGRTNQLAPKFTGYISGEYTWDVGANLALHLRSDVVHSSKYLQSLNLDPVATQPSYTKINARLALGDTNDRWEVAVVGRNLTDKTTISYAGDTPLAFRLFSARSYYGFVDPPRAIALEGQIKF